MQAPTPVFQYPITVLNGQTLSNTVDLSNNSLVGFLAPQIFVTNNVTLEVSSNGTDWYQVIKDTDATTQVNLYNNVAQATAYKVDISIFAFFKYVRLRFGTAVTADRVFTLLARPLE